MSLCRYSVGGESVCCFRRYDTSSTDVCAGVVTSVAGRSGVGTSTDLYGFIINDVLENTSLLHICRAIGVDIDRAVSIPILVYGERGVGTSVAEQILGSTLIGRTCFVHVCNIGASADVILATDARTVIDDESETLALTSEVVYSNRSARFCIECRIFHMIVDRRSGKKLTVVDIHNKTGHPLRRNIYGYGSGACFYRKVERQADKL